MNMGILPGTRVHPYNDTYKRNTAQFVQTHEYTTLNYHLRTLNKFPSAQRGLLKRVFDRGQKQRVAYIQIDVAAWYPQDNRKISTYGIIPILMELGD